MFGCHLGSTVCAKDTVNLLLNIGDLSVAISGYIHFLYRVYKRRQSLNIFLVICYSVAVAPANVIGFARIGCSAKFAHDNRLTFIFISLCKGQMLMSAYTALNKLIKIIIVGIKLFAILLIMMKSQNIALCVHPTVI